MNRRQFIGLAAGVTVAATSTSYWLSDRANLLRADLTATDEDRKMLTRAEEEILYLASLAPSGHNTQPWFVQYLKPYHWIIGNDQSKWLPAVDPAQRETVLSIGAFLHNLEVAAGSFGYECRWQILAETNQDERVVEVNLVKDGASRPFDTEAIKARRTVRAGLLTDALKTEHLEYLVGVEDTFIHYLPAAGREGRFVSDQTLEANRLQSHRDPAQRELSDWIRFSSEEAKVQRDGLTTGSMEIEGMAGWVVRNFYGKNNVLKDGFREQSIKKVRAEVSELAGWILVTSQDESVTALLAAGRRMQRLFLKARGRNIGIHPMTQILEEPATKQTFNQSVGISDPVQFLLRVGYLKSYPPPVSLRRPVGRFVRYD